VAAAEIRAADNGSERTQGEKGATKTMGQKDIFDEKVERILPEVERQVMARHRGVVGVREAFKAGDRRRLHLHVHLRSDRSFPYSVNSRHIMEENIGEMVTSIIWAVAHLEQGVI